MRYSTYRFTLDLQKHQSQISIAVFQYDTAVRLYISLTDGGIPYHIADGCRAVFYGKRPDGTDLVHNCAIEGNTRIIYDFNDQTACCEGTVDAQICLYGIDGDIITAPRLIIVASPRTVNPINIDLEDSPLVALDQIIASETAREYAEKARDKAENGVLDDGKGYIVKGRVQAEADRAKAEESRVEAENARKSAEADRVKAEEARSNKYLAHPDEPNQNHDTVPVVKRKTTNDVSYVTVSNGVAADVIVKRTVDNQNVGGTTVAAGNIIAPSPDKIPDEGDVYASVNKVIELAPSLITDVVTNATIQGIEIANGTTYRGAVEKGEYGAFFAKGNALTISYTTQNSYQSISGQMHFIWIYKMPTYDRIVHFAYSGYSFAAHDYELHSNIDVRADGAGVRFIRMPMKSI